MNLISKLYVTLANGATISEKRWRRRLSILWLSITLWCIFSILMDVISYYLKMDLQSFNTQPLLVLQISAFVEVLLIYFILSRIYTKEKTAILLEHFLNEFQNYTIKKKILWLLVTAFSPIFSGFASVIIHIILKKWHNWFINDLLYWTNKSTLVIKKYTRSS